MPMNAATPHATHYHDKRARLAAPMDRDMRDRPPAALVGLVDLIKAPAGPDLDAIAVGMQTLDVSEETLEDAVYPDARAYVRTLIYRDPRVELLVLTWLTGQRSPVHDHGLANCIVRIVSGEATENLYRRREFGAAKRECMSRALRTGTVSRLSADMLHSIGNDAAEPLITLHVYTPPLH